MEIHRRKVIAGFTPDVSMGPHDGVGGILHVGAALGRYARITMGPTMVISLGLSNCVG